ncbi:zinc ribbon domain-containing protein [Enterococcus sp. 5H]|uniref:zinc ribbon domain-containing protein n=1 Tax=Enterococcus sp. 5H TaxID=1229490 RepID=UPI0023027BA0|nr:zinc ribbon domain-containing protein [Enterococcus sp. 5H]MDA9470936.1 hypothetical protein [Enterococcus sp. 5H]
MKNCVKCGAEISEGAKFCNVCGRNQEAEKVNATQSEPVVEKNVPIQEKLSEQLKDNQTVQQLTNESKNYFRWLNQQIKISDKRAESHVPLFGFINFILLIVLNSIALSVSIGRFSFFVAKAPLASFFESVTVVGVYFSLLFFGFYFIVNRRRIQKLQFTEVFDALLSPASVVVYISLGSVLLSLIMIESISFTVALLLLSALIVSLSFVDQIFKISGAFGRFFLTLFTMAVPLTILFFILKFIVETRMV